MILRIMDEDQIYSIIEEQCTKLYRLTDRIYGFPYVRREDFKAIDPINAIYTAHFRLPFDYGEYGIRSVFNDVCSKVNAQYDFVIIDKEEYKIPYKEVIVALKIEGEKDEAI